MSSAAIHADAIHFSYGTRTALNGVSFSVSHGSLFGLLGPNGSGKTTLFRLLSTLIPVQIGRISICGQDVSQCQSAVRKSLGVTFQSPAVDLRLTVEENLKCHGKIYGFRGHQLRDRIAQLLERFQLTDRSSTLVGELSGGLKRRVELAKGLMHNPKVLLLDEPTTGLDPRARQEFWDLLLTHVKSLGTTVIVATHLMNEAELCDDVLLLDRGMKVASGSPADLQTSLSGERLTLQVRDAVALQTRLETVLRGSVAVQGNRISVRVQNPADQIQLLLNEFRDEILSLHLTRPSLDDVFLELTGRSLADSETTNE